ncbi:hypothetical protein T310_2570 [Rasamsonia emersonii CBS 393.64]|uniref:Uncharacterized protein n=1 Tax=Rasamsonia emersonii (strain ATCC 16479 / CBS 393.64 / IMI 116815) TaxID=1408163 RepID=A0A0F4YYM2_RASE3|nr:hypothetical protein T310_2570 [Rasamsonia emersonii CBS 393.64]KKA23397.1 hypothetical protein T310_2570 [Rasamsonia emersonii CBS 393.64]
MSNQGYYRERYQQSNDGRRLETGMTRTASPVYLQLPHAPNNARPSKHTMLQYASLEDVPYREQWLRQLEERTAQQEHNTARGQQRRRQQHRNGNPYERFHSQQGTVQGQQHQSFTPQNTDQPPFVAGNAASLQYAFEQNGQHPQFAVPMRRRTDVCTQSHITIFHRSGS